MGAAACSPEAQVAAFGPRARLGSIQWARASGRDAVLPPEVTAHCLHLLAVAAW